jgi:hypothetical protein
MCHCITEVGILEKLEEEKTMRIPEIYISPMELSKRSKKTKQILSIYKAKKDRERELT